jgi:hypothetical protein
VKVFENEDYKTSVKKLEKMPQDAKYSHVHGLAELIQ